MLGWVFLKPDKEEWQGVVGKHGIDERNEAGEEFLQFVH